MVHYDKTEVMIEVFSDIGVVRDRLIDAGYAFTERDIYSNQFWGKQFRVARPIGKGARAKMKFLLEEVTR